VAVPRRPAGGLRWSHPTDLAEAPLAWHDVGFHTGERGRPNRNGDNYFSLPPVIDGDELRLTIPAPAPITGPGLILFNLGESVGDATTCGGASRCDYRASRSYHHTVDIER
jgi:hypothetical protein